MQPQRPCPYHEQNQISYICLSVQCQHPQIFCPACSDKHNKHQIVGYTDFQTKYSAFQKLNSEGSLRIKDIFKQVRQTFSVCINKAEQFVLKEYLPAETNRPLLSLKDIESQQLLGVIREASKSPKFKSLAYSNINFGNFQTELAQFLQLTSNLTHQLSSSIMSAINKLTNQAKLQKIVKSSKIEKNSPNIFQFVDKYKPKSFTIYQKGLNISRTYPTMDGLSMFSVVDQPLSLKNNQISFKLESQINRFVYVGVCDKETFRLNNFHGDLYAMGRKMYAIRQSSVQGKKGVTLHNSIHAFSNKQIVPFDFEIGDVITIRYFESELVIHFIKNGVDLFEMPLDTAISKFYPFVGLKFCGDSMKIVSGNGKKQKKSIFSSFMS